MRSDEARVRRWIEQVRHELVDSAYGMTVYLSFSCWRAGRSSPIVAWLRALTECGGHGVGAAGMGFTAGHALAMMTELAVVAPVLSQPSMPVAFGSRRRAAGIDASPEDVACAKRRFEREGLSMIGLRFKSDKLVPQARFDTYRREFGDKFESIKLGDDDALRNPYRPHSVLTMHLREDGSTKAAEQRVIAFLKARTGGKPIDHAALAPDVDALPR
ncbi:DUF1949 domain-containing protein [Burkholderia gladioli]|uniref:DUF1949 domain-containing protein n=1 Tax=Burkholderia gladioli TaxID=28095 RepID=UPI003F7AD9A1